MGVFYSLILLILLLFVVPGYSDAQVINEICPTSSDGHLYEWVEIYNDTENSISTDGIMVVDENNKKLIFSSSEVLSHSYILATASSTLNNNGDTVYIKNKDGTVITSQSYSGDYSHNTTFLKCNDGNWHQTTSPSPLSSNEANCQISPSDSITVNFIQDYHQIYISEVMIDPPTEEKEWVELYNDNNFEAYLQNWQIDDEENSGTTPIIFTLKISPYSYASIDLPKSMLNNDKDVVRLVNHDSVQKDLISYIGSQNEKSAGRINFSSSSTCPQNPTKNSLNSGCISSPSTTNSQAPSSTKTLTPTNPGNLPISTESTEPAQIATQSSFSLPDLIGSIKGITTNNRVFSTKKNDKKQLKTSMALSATSFMFSWANIFYILIKLNRKYKQHCDENFK